MEIAEVEVVVGETPITPPTIIIIKVNQIRQRPPNHTKKVPNILTYLPVLAGPVPSTGRKAVGRHIVVTPWSVSGIKSSHLVPPEKSANLDK